MNAVLTITGGAEILFANATIVDLSLTTHIQTAVIGRKVPIEHLLFGDEEPWTICTNSGIEFNIFEPTADCMNLEDIVHGLSKICRFSGQFPDFYSVLQHSILVEYLCSAPELGKYCLLHDAPETYLIDLIAPLKQGLNGVAYACLEAKYLVAIAEKFGLNANWFNRAELKAADMDALNLELLYRKGDDAQWNGLWQSVGFESNWNPARALDLGLRIYKPSLK